MGGDSPKGKKINMELSFARAEAIKNMLINKNFSSENITILGKGDLEPLVKPNSDNKDAIIEELKYSYFLTNNIYEN